jgi:hypothetical protein
VPPAGEPRATSAAAQAGRPRHKAVGGIVVQASGLHCLLRIDNRAIRVSSHANAPGRL